MARNSHGDRAARSDSNSQDGVSRRAYLAGAGTAGLAATAGCVDSLTGSGGSGGTPTINVITWEEFEDMQDNIEDTLDVELNITASSSSAEMFSQWNAGQDEQYDIAVPNNNLVPRFMEADLIEPVDRDVVSSFDDLYDSFQSLAEEQFSDGGDVYGVPIRFGWYGYAYDTREVPEHEPSYDIMFDEDYVDVDLDGEIVMYDEHNKTMPVGALYLGYEDVLEGERMDFSSDQLDDVKNLLIEQKPRLQGYISSDPTFIQEFQQGNFLVGHSGRNEVVELWDQGADWAEFVVPREGAMAWYETAVVSKKSDNKETAWEVVNEFVAPENGAALARAGYSPSCNPGVAEQLDDEENELFGKIDPSRLEGMIPFKAVASDIEDEYETAWDEVKAA